MGEDEDDEFEPRANWEGTLPLIYTHNIDKQKQKQHVFNSCFWSSVLLLFVLAIPKNIHTRAARM